LRSCCSHGTSKFIHTLTYLHLAEIRTRFNPETYTGPSTVELKTPKELLSRIVAEDIAVADVIADRVIETSAAATDIMRLLARAAADLGLPDIVKELGTVQALGQTNLLENIPEVKPTLSPGDNEVAFNIANLRKHLGQATLARNTLSDDIAARQKLLEQSVYADARERMEQSQEEMKALNLGPRLQHVDLQKWMWQWHSQLREKLKADIQAVIEEENSWTGACLTVTILNFHD
jgi:DNA-directed RNA polymerase, mitochondrial